MRTPRLFVECTLGPGRRLALPPEAARHAARVLRLAPGAAVRLFDGTGGEYPARIVAVARERVEVELGALDARECESPLAVTLAQGISRGERMDYTVQKAVELGVGRIVPIAAERSTVRLDAERAAKRVEHWRRVAIGACEQCGRNRVPDIEPVQELDAWLARLPATGLRLLLQPEASEPLAALDIAPPVTLLVGPEGGLSGAERESAAAAGFTAARLGPRVLRTETAALVALTLLQTRAGDLAS